MIRFTRRHPLHAEWVNTEAAAFAEQNQAQALCGRTQAATNNVAVKPDGWASAVGAPTPAMESAAAGLRRAIAERRAARAEGEA